MDIQQITSVFKSKIFQENLKEQANNLFNLKLEYFFRDQLVIGLNKEFNGLKVALAEYPRWQGKRVDVSICKKVESFYELETMIELKYQFSGDFHSFKEYNIIFERERKLKIETEKTGPNLFILIVADWSEVCSNRSILENKFIPAVNCFNQFQHTNSKFGDWKQNVLSIFEGLKCTTGLIQIDSQHNIDFHFHIVEL